MGMTLVVRGETLYKPSGRFSALLPDKLLQVVFRSRKADSVELASDESDALQEDHPGESVLVRDVYREKQL
jgi:hypothetical protein